MTFAKLSTEAAMGLLDMDEQQTKKFNHVVEMMKTAAYPSIARVGRQDEILVWLGETMIALASEYAIDRHKDWFAPSPMMCHFLGHEVDFGFDGSEIAKQITDKIKAQPDWMYEPSIAMQKQIVGMLGHSTASLAENVKCIDDGETVKASDAINDIDLPHEYPIRNMLRLILRCEWIDRQIAVV